MRVREPLFPKAPDLGGEPDERSNFGIMIGGNMGNPNPMKQAYTCQTCGEPRPPYQFYCDRHLKDGEKNDKPLLVDRIMKRIFGRS